MENISRVWMGPLPKDSRYVKPFRFYYIQNGVEKQWDLLTVHDSVSIVIFNKTRNKLVLVRQFRPAVFHGAVTSSGESLDYIDLAKFPPQLGVTLELCAGIVDKNKNWNEIAREEVLEECGYDLPLDRIIEVMTCRDGTGAYVTKQKMFYCEVTDDDKSASGGGVGSELIEVVELSLNEAKKMVEQGANNNSPPGCLLGIMWFLMNRAPQY